MAEGLRGLLLGSWWRYTISLVGTMILAVGVASVLLDATLSGAELRQVAAVVVFSLSLIAVGARIALVVRERDRLALVLGWMSLGVLVFALVSTWYAVVLRTVQTEFEVALVFLSILSAGALFGAVVGYYDVRVRRLVDRASREQARRELLDERQETLSSLTGILRHQVLNGLTAISGQAELLAAGKVDSEQASEAILDRSESMEATVERIETLVDILAHTTETGSWPVRQAVERARETAADADSAVTVDLRGDTDATVAANELLHLALAELFDNSAVHADGAVTVTVTTRGEVVEIEVADDGPGIDLRADALFRPNERGRDSDGDGLGLYFAALIVEQYGGKIRLRDDDATGTSVLVELPAAERKQGEVRESQSSA
jgi:two-component system OmpR family sensor kinase